MNSPRVSRGHDISSRRNCLSPTSTSRRLKRDNSRLVQGGEHTEEIVMMPHTEMCEKSENRQEGDDVDGRPAPQNDETAGILK